jgi:hypothetical protein
LSLKEEEEEKKANYYFTSSGAPLSIHQPCFKTSSPPCTGNIIDEIYFALSQHTKARTWRKFN